MAVLSLLDLAIYEQDFFAASVYPAILLPVGANIDRDHKPSASRHGFPLRS